MMGKGRGPSSWFTHQPFLEPSSQANSPAPSGLAAEIAVTKVCPIPENGFLKQMLKGRHTKRCQELCQAPTWGTACGHHFKMVRKARKRRQKVCPLGFVRQPPLGLSFPISVESGISIIFIFLNRTTLFSNGISLEYQP